VPPILFIASTAGSLGASSFTFDMPTKARPSDVLIAAMWTANTGQNVDDDPTWIELLSLTTGSGQLLVVGRVVDGTEGHTIELPIANPGGAFLVAGLLMYRGAGLSLGPVDGSGTLVSASTNWPCPSRTPAVYSDMYLGFACSTTATAFAPPGGCIERFEAASVGELEIFELLPEATTATGVKTATTGVAGSGLAASALIPAGGLVAIGKVLAFDPPGALGLPTEGV